MLIPNLVKKRQAQNYYGAFEKLARSFPRIYDRNYALFLADQGRRLSEGLVLAQHDLKLRPGRRRLQHIGLGLISSRQNQGSRYRHAARPATLAS